MSSPLQINGLVSGLNTAQIIQALLLPYEQPIQNLQAQQTALETEAKDYQTINSDIAALETAARALNTPTSGWNAAQATSSDTAVATATASPGTPSGQVSFTVAQLAQAASLTSSGAVASTADVVTTSPSFLVAQDGQALGFSELSAGSGLGLGSVQVKVTQASQAAVDVGSAALASSVTIGSSNDTIQLTVNGTAYTLTIAGGTYSPSQLASAIDQAASAAGAPVLAGINGSGELVLGTVEQGSSASIQVTGGTALSTLSLPTQSAAATGVNAIVEVGGTTNTLSALNPGQTLTLSSGTGGSLLATVASTTASPLSSQISEGSLTAYNVSTGNGSLADVVSNINAAGAGVTASAVQTSSGYVLTITSQTTGTASQFSVNTQAFSSALGTLSTTQAGQNAVVYLGGNPADQVSSSTNAVTGLLPGLTVNLVAPSSTLVTVSVAPDAQAVAASVSNLVQAANKVLSDISQYSGYDAQTKVAGPLNGSPFLQSIEEQILALFGTAQGSSSQETLASAGITLNSNGTISFDQATFEAAYTANPSQVQALFTQGGVFQPSGSAYSPSQVSLVYASKTAEPGSYAISISQSATQATDTGTYLAPNSSGVVAVSAGETLTVTMNGTSATYSTQAGETLTAIASGLNQAFAQAGMGLSAVVVTNSSGDQALELESSAYGSAASFTVQTTNASTGTTGLTQGSTSSVTYTGTDVAGTITPPGSTTPVAATGNGQVLSIPSISFLVTIPGITTATSVGSYAYEPGLAERLVSAADSWSNPATGVVSTTIQNLDNQATGLNPEIAFYQQLANEEQKMLEAQFAELEATLGQLKNQGNVLSAAIAQLGGVGVIP